MRYGYSRRTGSKKKRCPPGKVSVYSKKLGKSRCYDRRIVLQRKYKKRSRK